MEARRSVRKAVRAVKNRWFQAKAAEASAGRNGEKMVRKCVKDIQSGRRELMARVIQGRLQMLAEDELPEGRGCMDMVFSVRQLVEKSWEDKEKLFITFVDLKKAYNSVLREAMWKVLRKFGVKNVIVNLIKSFHRDESA